MRIVVLDGRALNPGDLSWRGLEELGELSVYERSSPAEVVSRAEGVEVVLTNKTPLGGAELARLRELRYIGVLATGYNIVDVAEAARRGVVVTNIPTYGTDSVAQFTFALLLELCHRTGEHAAVAWPSQPDWSAWRGPLIELAGRVLGIVGFGRIGRRTAEIGAALGMRVLACDPVGGRVDLDTLLAESDVVSLHCPLTPQTQGLIDAARLRRFKPSAFLINTARGGLIVEPDLAGALNAGRLAGAALDVLSQEPPPPDHPLLSARNCVVTPHIAWATVEARRRLMQTAVDNLAAFLRGQPINVVRA